jgi:pSer/pThr/pTyr-binding forkhead associated (FHA) protein
MEIRLSVCKDDGPTKSLNMHCNPFRIGRSDECDLQLHSRSISRMHCELKVKRSGLTIKDLGSRNGTIVNGVATPVGVRVILRANDQIKIGKYQLGILSISGTTLSSIDEVSLTTDVPNSDVPKDESDAGGDLLGMLEQFILDHRNHLPTAETLVLEGGNESDKSHDQWTQLRQPAVEAEGETLADSGQGSKFSDPTLETTVTIEAKNELPPEDMPTDEADARRLELRSKLDGLKAKDSREAADRALKNLFRR